MTTKTKLFAQALAAMTLAIATFSSGFAMAQNNGIGGGPYQTCGVTHTCGSPTIHLKPHIPTVPPVAKQ